MVEAYLYRKIKGKTAQCQTCAHYCIIENGQRGICGVRKNKNGKIYSLVYGKPCAIHIDPIEKKPFFHFLPGTRSLSLATAGCNFTCANCQNWSISQGPKISDEIDLPSFSKSIEGEKKITPKNLVELALKNNVPSISYTYTEPTVFLEYALDTMKLAKKKNLKNAWVTNGFLSKESFELIAPYLDAANVDLKSFSNDFYAKYCGGQLFPVLETLKLMKKNKIWTEITTLVIPGLNDSEKNFKDTALFIKNELGPETPWHISRFSGTASWKFQDLPDTPLPTLALAHRIGIETGLKYVYCGNVSGIESENTFCPHCQEKMISRIGYSVKRADNKGRCSKCNEKLNIIE